MKKRILPLCMCLLILLSGCSYTKITEKSSERSISFFAMDTYMEFTAYGDDAKSAITTARDKIADLELLWSVTNENSDIYAINHAEGQAVEVADETAEILKFTLGMSERTNGALDPTVYPILSAWGFTAEENRIPSEDEISELLPLVGYKNVIPNGNTVQLAVGSMLDLGAVGKGYAGDIVVKILRENGITSAILNLGGNVQTIGSRPDGSDWRIGLQDPNGNGKIGVIEVSDLAVVTSGAYERYFIGEDGKKYGHIIDPATGYPIENDLLSVTVIAKEGKLCDALSTSLFVMGLDRACEYWRQNQDFDMILITDSNDIYLTDGISESFTLDSDRGNMKVHVISE